MFFGSENKGAIQGKRNFLHPNGRFDRFALLMREKRRQVCLSIYAALYLGSLQRRLPTLTQTTM